MPNINARKSYSGFPNPFRTYSHFIYPDTVKDIFVWAEYLWERNAKYRTAIQKVVSYFISGISVDQEEKAKAVDSDSIDGFKKLLLDSYDILSLMLKIGTELAATGNVFISAERIFDRNLLCPVEKCGWQMRLKNLHKGEQGEYKWTGTDFQGICPKCGNKVKYKIHDLPSQDLDGRKLRFVFRPAEDMCVQYNRLTDTFKYLYKIPEDIMSAIKRGDVVYLEDSPKVFLDAVASNERYIEFDPETFFSDRTVTLTSLDKLYKGWGMPLFMSAFDNLVRLQHLDKFNEAVIMDYLIPTRIISPEPQNLTASVGDPNRMPLSGASFRNFMQSAIGGLKGNYARTIISPVATRYQQMGGDKDIIPADLLEWETGQALSDMGLPMEFRQTTFQVVAQTMGLRMFEKQWIHFAKSLNKATKWIGEQTSHVHHFENLVCSLDTTSFVEDDMNKQVLLGLMQGQVIARTPVLKRLGVDFEDDVKLRMKEQQTEADAAQEQQTGMESSEMVRSVIPPAATPGLGAAQMSIQMADQQAQAQAQGGMPGAPAAPMAPGQPMGPGLGPGGGAMPFNRGASETATIEQLFQQAQTTAQQLYNAQPHIRRQQLVELKASNPTMHAMVKQLLTDMSQQVASDAVAQSRQPQG